MPPAKNINSKSKDVFIGGNYDNIAVLREIKKYVKEAKFCPQLAIDKYPKLSLEETHDKDIELAKSCPTNIYEGTFSAGELMEVERAALREGVVKKILVVYQRRKKQALHDPTRYPTQMSSMLVSLAKGKPEIITLFGYPDFTVLRSFIKGFLGAPLEYECGCLLVFGIGTLDKARSERDIGALQSFPRTKVLFTGWSLDRCLKEARQYNVHVVISEACMLYLKPGDGWDKVDETTEGSKLYKNESIGNVKLLNELILGEIYSVDSMAVLFSQGNKISVNYYVNPTKGIEGSPPLTEFGRGKEAEAQRFRDWVVEESANKISKSEVTIINNKRLKLIDNENSRYYIEKANAIHRTFSPYVLKPEEGYITVDLLNPEPKYKHFGSEDEARKWLERIVDRAKARAKLNPKYERLPEDAWDCVTAQDDGSIDILPQTKEKSWREALTILKSEGLYSKEETPTLYISRGTENDLPFIIDRYNEGNFYAFGVSDVVKSPWLREAGVIVKDNLSEILNLIQPKRQAED